MNFTDCINALEEYAAAPEDAGVDNDFFIDVVNFVKDQEKQIDFQVDRKEDEKTQRIKLEQENKQLTDEVKQLRDEVEQLRYKLKDEVAGWSPTSSPEPKMNN